mmetsp:Transcript_9351/g.18677  ORF Transcript_9351/g.18677 Transcript_9351/m.18677 type:complete len:411 (+) Transcript_9351:1442-2674(+)
MVEMHHRGAHGLVHNLQTRLEFIVLEEAEDAEEDREEVPRQLLPRHVVHLLEDGLVLVGGDDDGVVEDLLDDVGAQDDEGDEAAVVRPVQHRPVVEPLPEAHLDDGGDELAHVGARQPEHPHHEDHLERQPSEISAGEVRLHVERADVHLCTAVRLHGNGAGLRVEQPVHPRLVERHGDLGVGELAEVAVVEGETDAHRPRILIKPLHIAEVLDLAHVFVSPLREREECAEPLVDGIVLEGLEDGGSVALEWVLQLRAFAKLGGFELPQVFRVVEDKRPVARGGRIGSDALLGEARGVEQMVHPLARLLEPALLHNQDPADEEVVLEEEATLIGGDRVPVVPLLLEEVSQDAPAVVAVERARVGVEIFEKVVEHRPMIQDVGESAVLVEEVVANHAIDLACVGHIELLHD